MDELVFLLRTHIGYHWYQHTRPEVLVCPHGPEVLAWTRMGTKSYKGTRLRLVFGHFNSLKITDGSQANSFV